MTNLLKLEDDRYFLFYNYILLEIHLNFKNETMLENK